MTPRVQLDDWDTLSTELHRFGQAGDVTISDERIHIDFGSAHVELTQNGTLKHKFFICVFVVLFEK